MMTWFSGTIARILLQVNLEGEAISSAVLVFLVSLIVGAVAIGLAAQVVIDRDTGFRRAAVTALIGAIVYAVVGLFFGWIPLLGPLLMLLAWIAVIKWQYPGGWGTAIAIGFVAWLIAVVIVFVLSRVGFVRTEALGIPGI